MWKFIIYCNRKNAFKSAHHVLLPLTIAVFRDYTKTNFFVIVLALVSTPTLEKNAGAVTTYKPPRNRRRDLLKTATVVNGPLSREGIRV